MGPKSHMQNKQHHRKSLLWQQHLLYDNTDNVRNIHIVYELMNVGASESPQNSGTSISSAFYAKSHPSMLQNFYIRKQCVTPQFLKKATTMTFLWDLVTQVFFFQGEMLVCHSKNWYLSSGLHTKTQDSSPAIIFNKKSASCTDHSRSPAAMTIWYTSRIVAQIYICMPHWQIFFSESSELIHIRRQFICYCLIITYQSDVMTV